MSFIANNTGIASSAPDGLTLGAGTVSSPTLRLADADTTTGFYRSAVNEVALSSAGIQTLLVSAAGALIAGPATGLTSSHLFQSAGSSGAVNVRNTGNDIAAFLAFSTNSGTIRGQIGSSATNAFEIYNEAVVLSSFMDQNGTWTFGPDSGLTTRHTIRNSSTTTADSVLRLEKLAVAAGTADTLYLEFYGSSGGNDGNIANNGAGALTLVDASDARLKTNVRDASYGLSTILALRPVEFDWLTGGANVKGFIAQEVAPILPESVVVREANGLPDMHFLETQTMIPVLVKAIQELEARIAALEGAQP